MFRSTDGLHMCCREDGCDKVAVSAVHRGTEVARGIHFEKHHFRRGRESSRVGCRLNSVPAMVNSPIRNRKKQRGFACASTVRGVYNEVADARTDAYH